MPQPRLPDVHTCKPLQLVPLHSGFDRLRRGEPWDHWSDPKYDLLELSLLKSRPEHRSAYQRNLPGLAASGANRSKPLCRGTSSLSDLSKNRDFLEYYVSRSPENIV